MMQKWLAYLILGVIIIGTLFMMATWEKRYWKRIELEQKEKEREGT